MIRLAPGYIDPAVEMLDDDLVRVRFTDAILGHLVEVTASLDQMAEWERGGAIPADLHLRRWPLDEAIASARARRDQLEARRADLLGEHPDLEAEP